MRQKEVMGQSIRTSKSARPGTIIYVPLDKSEFRSTVSSDKKKNKIMKIVVMLIVMILVMSCCVYAGISYYYSYHFFLGTTINGIDSSNKTAYEVEQEIAGKKDNYVIQVSARMQDPQAITGKDIDIQADSVCVHGDGAKALAFVEKIREAFVKEGIQISSLDEFVK